MISKPIITALLLSTSAAAVAETSKPADMTPSSSKTEATINHTPKIHGVLRTRWEGEFDNGFGQRFQVRNARLSVEGHVLPALQYYVRIDACDRGKMKILDAWAQWDFARSWQVQAGQFRVPFGVDCFRGPGGYYFSNRSFLGKQMLNMRAVGAQLAYDCVTLPLNITAGVFNSTAIGDHDTWQRGCDMTFAAKATWRIHNVALSASYVSTKPDSVRINIVDGAVTWQTGRWIVEGEYQNKHYDSGRHKSVNAWNVFASYAIPLKHTAFNNLSFQARFDGMTDHSSGRRNSNGLLNTTDPSRQRITLGSTLAFINKPVKAALRLDYEKYFYARHISAAKGENDKVVAELVVKF